MLIPLLALCTAIFGAFLWRIARKMAEHYTLKHTQPDQIPRERNPHAIASA